MTAAPLTARGERHRRNAAGASRKALLSLAPDAEGFLRRAVGNREQHRLLRRMVGVALPRRHHENVVRHPRGYVAFYSGRAFAFGAHEDDAVSRSIRLAFKPFR